MKPRRTVGIRYETQVFVTPRYLRFFKNKTRTQKELPSEILQTALAPKAKIHTIDKYREIKEMPS